MADRHPRQSTDQETAPLLRDTDTDDGANSDIQEEPSFKDKALNSIQDIFNEPLTPLSKLLLFITLIFLLLSSIFIGLFAGSQHKLNLERDRHDHDHSPPGAPPTRTTLTTTSTAIYTPTSAPPVPIPTGEPPEKVCLTPECIVVAANIFSSLDTSQDPCENFYDYANGGWLASHQVPADKGSFGNFEALAQQNKQVLRKVLEDTEPADNKYDNMLLKQIRGLYSSCLNETLLDERGDAPLRDFVHVLRKLYSGNSTDIGTSTTAEKKNDGLTATLSFLHTHGIDALFSFIVEGDAGVDPNDLLLWFYQPSLGLPSKEYYAEESTVELYREVIERLHFALQPDEETKMAQSPRPPLSLVAQGGEDNEWPPWPWPPWGPGDDDEPEPINETERIQNLTRKFIKFETALANASLDLDILQQDPFASYNPVNLTNITSTLTSIHFGNYFSSFTPRSFPSRVILTHPPYASTLAKLLEETDSEVIEFYLITRAALSLSPYLGTESAAWKAQRTLKEALEGIKKGAVGDRGEYCVQQVEDTLGLAAGRYFVNQTFGGDSKVKGTKIIEDIIEAFIVSLENLEWMDEKSSRAAAQKAKNIRVKVGYPISPDTENPYSLLRYYALSTVHPDKFFENILSAGKATVYRSWIQLGRKRDPEAWEMYPSMVNAYFNPPANEIVFPAGILQDPFFSKDWPNYLSYGAFGQVAAHELTHAFDSAGRLYNEHGKLEAWWTNETSAGFDKLQTCIVNQYSNYTIDDGKGGKVHVNGNLTSGENIGDSGIIQAYRAWKEQYHTSLQSGNEFLLPGLSERFSREQLFFIAFGRIWARDVKPAAAVQRIRVDPHSPSKYRVEGTLSNVPEFAEAFGCSKHSKLNPPREKQCRFWG